MFFLYVTHYPVAERGHTKQTTTALLSPQRKSENHKIDYPYLT